MKTWNIVSILTGVALIAASLFVPGPVGQTPAQASQGCPHDGGWDKVDGLSGYEYTYTAPDGKLVDAWCYKAANEVRTGEVEPPEASVTVVSEVFNKNGQRQELSHASFHLIDEPEDPTPTPTEPYPSPTTGTPTVIPTTETPPVPTDETPGPTATRPPKKPKHTPTPPVVPPTGGGWDGVLMALGTLLTGIGAVPPAIRKFWLRR